MMEIVSILGYNFIIITSFFEVYKVVLFPAGNNIPPDFNGESSSKKLIFI